MFFCGTVFCGGNMSCAMTPSDTKDITYIELKHGIYDDLYITNKASGNMDPVIPDEWDWDTVMYAQFNGNTNAGNVEFSINNTSHLLIKRRKVNDYKWTTLYVKEIIDIEDFSINSIDYTNSSETEYEYAIINSLYGIDNIAGSMKVKSSFDGVFIVEKDGIWGTKLTDGVINTRRNFPNSTEVTVHNKYPSDINTSVACYDTGTCTGNWIRMSDECELEIDDIFRVPYQRSIIDILSDRKPKLLKAFDGRTWLCKIDDGIDDSADDSYNNRKITFNFTEIGDYKSEEDLFYANLSDITEEFWNR